MFKVRLSVDAVRGTLSRELVQPSRPLILDTLAEMRKAEPMADRQGLGRWALSIPFEDWVRLREKYPELATNDPATRTRFYRRFIASEESRPFRVRERV